MVDLSFLLQRGCHARTGLRQVRTAFSRNFGAISAAKHPLLLDRAIGGFKNHHPLPCAAHRQEDSSVRCSCGTTIRSTTCPCAKNCTSAPSPAAIRACRESVYGYLNNPLLQEELSFIPLATCFDYAHAPAKYRAESSWTKIVRQRFGAEALPHWRALRSYAEASIAAKKDKRPLQLTPAETRRLRAAYAYVERNRGRRWVKELAPWRAAIVKLITGL